MRNKVNFKLILAILVGISLVSLVFLVLPDERFRWSPTFNSDGDQPYDLSLFKNTLSQTLGEDGFEVLESLSEDSNALSKPKALLIYVGDYEEFDSLEADKLMSFAEAGGSVLMSSRFEHAVLRLYLDRSEDEETSLKIKKAKKIYPKLYISPDSARIPYMVRTKNPRYDWVYFDKIPNKAEPIGRFNAIGEEFVNLVLIEEGAGNMVFHTNPLIFTNYHFRNEDVFKHVGEILEGFEFEHVYWFEPSFILPNSQDPILSESPLRFILSQASLRWAWYIIIALAVIFVWNGARRRQRAVEIINVPVNETAIYLDVVSRFYKKAGSHMHIVRVQEKILHRHLKNRYRLNFTNPSDAVFREAEIKLNMKASDLKEFFQALSAARRNSTLSDQDLLSINQRIKNFYEKCP